MHRQNSAHVKQRTCDKLTSFLNTEIIMKQLQNSSIEVTGAPGVKLIAIKVKTSANTEKTKTLQITPSKPLDKTKSCWNGLQTLEERAGCQDDRDLIGRF